MTNVPDDILKFVCSLPQVWVCNSCNMDQGGLEVKHPVGAHSYCTDCVAELALFEFQRWQDKTQSDTEEVNDNDNE